MRILAALIFFGAIPFSYALEEGGVYRLNAYYSAENTLIFNPQSSSPTTLTVKKGEIKKTFLKTAIVVDVKILSPCILSCDVEVLVVNDVIAPHALPEALAKKPDLKIKPGSL